ncbi:helix-turn-helix domain-containing protein [Magnetococcus sp. PR-3]|uniref:helix-turn-helix domain-containing protein n=1 Tax=Magnetococcus sp. PR-3 TaxID=3120355 RepID=UPI002FCDFBA1
MSDPQTLQKSHFTANNLDPDDRTEAWRESIGTLFDIKLSNQVTDDQFHASVTSHLLNEQLMLAHCQTRAQLFTRNALRTTEDGLDYYMIQTHFSGEQHFTVGSKTHVCRPGDVAVLDLADLHHSQASDFSNLSLVVPRMLLAPLLENPDSQEGRVLQADNPLTTIARTHFHTLHRIADQLTPDEAAQLVQPTLMLMASAINGTTEQVDQGANSIVQVTLLQIKTEIEHMLSHPKLTTDYLCSKLHISRSSLYRLFKPVGGIHKYIQKRRLRRCAEALLHPAHQHRSIADIAFGWGFTSQSHFSSLFKEHFQVSPKAFRENRASHQLTQQSSPFDDPKVGDRIYETWLSKTLRI